MKFSEWYSKKLTVGAYPYLINGRFEAAAYQYCINVSDEYNDEAAQRIIQAGTRYFWFPMNECRKDIGLNSIYGALCILYQAEQAGAAAYLHCHAGANRSPIVQQCYYYARNGCHSEGGSDLRCGQLMDAVARGHLPPIGEMRKFLSKIGERLAAGDTGGFLETCKLDAIRNF